MGAGRGLFARLPPPLSLPHMTAPFLPPPPQRAAGAPEDAVWTDSREGIPWADKTYEGLAACSGPGSSLP